MHIVSLKRKIEMKSDTKLIRKYLFRIPIASNVKRCFYYHKLRFTWRHIRKVGGQYLRNKHSRITGGILLNTEVFVIIIQIK